VLREPALCYAHPVAMRTLVLFFALTLAAHAGAPMTPADVDAELAARFAAAKLEPSPPADDPTFLRRVWLDLVGSIPTLSAQGSFASDASQARRAHLIDRMIGTRRFAVHWAEVLATMVLGRQSKLDENQRRAFEHWLAERLARPGVGLDRIARDIIVAEGTPIDNPAIAVLHSFEDAKEDMAGHLSKVFLGSQIQCAQCHDHPFEKWKRTDFYGMTAFFARVRRVQFPVQAYEKLRSGEVVTAAELSPYLNKPLPADPKNPQVRQVQTQMERLRVQWALAKVDPLAYRGADSLDDAAESMGMGSELSMAQKNGKAPKDLPLLVEMAEGEIEIPRPGGSEPATGAGGPKPKKQWVQPKFLGGATPPYPDGGLHRRDRLAKWMTAPDNPYFARAMVNRVWARLMGRGLVEPVDNVANPTDATHAALLGRLALHFVATGHDLRALVKLIVSTNAYQRSSIPNHTNAKDTVHFSRALVRPLEPEQIFASILEATGIEHTFKNGRGQEFLEMKRRFEREFVFRFQVDEVAETVAYQGTVTQALFTLNSPAFNRPVRNEPGSALAEVRAITDTPGRIRMLVRRALSRDPTPEEAAALAAYVKSRSEDPTWGTRQGPAPAPSAPPAAAKKPARPPPMPVVRRHEAMWRGYEDILWSMIASTEFVMNH
jgi:hypothetical protein